MINKNKTIACSTKKLIMVLDELGYLSLLNYKEYLSNQEYRDYVDKHANDWVWLITFRLKAGKPSTDFVRKLISGGYGDSDQNHSSYEDGGDGQQLIRSRDELPLIKKRPRNDR